MVKLRLAYASDFNNDYNDWLGNRGRRARHQADIDRDAGIKLQVQKFTKIAARRMTAKEYFNAVVLAIKQPR
uniref:Uncharacterized protein n=1 Tax=Ditylenchus dipsaci TaxID=166011 RepID=A0A915ES33_9BILA